MKTGLKCRRYFREETRDFYEYFQRRFAERMKSSNISCRDLSGKLHEELGLGENSSYSLIGNLRNCASFVFPSEYPAGNDLPAEERLRRIAIVLDELNFSEEDDIILRLRRKYKYFQYPPVRSNGK